MLVNTLLIVHYIYFSFRYSRGSDLWSDLITKLMVKCNTPAQLKEVRTVLARKNNNHGVFFSAFICIIRRLNRLFIKMNVQLNVRYSGQQKATEKG